ALEDPELAEAALAEAKGFLERYTESSLVPQALGLTSDLLIRLDREEEAAGYLAALVVGNPESPLWAEYGLKLGRLYLGPLRDEERAQIVLKAVVEGAPESEAAAEAETLLGR
ncbi:MAG: tetratricopeptide repeat protein, partial [Spirochaetota bacterium]